jgi:hypothetical protein
MLAIGSTGQTPPAQAAPVGEIVNFSMTVQDPKTTLRCGETVTYVVKVELAQSEFAPTPVPGSMGLPKGMSVIGINVDASSKDPSVGDFVGARNAKTAVVLDADLATLGAKFKFKANKPGKTTLYFEGLVGKEYVSFNLDVKVLPCKFRATTIGEWHVDGPANISVVAISDDAEVSGDAQGSVTGSASVNWVLNSGQVADCLPQSVTTSSQVDWSGQVDDNEQLTLDGTYQPAAMSLPVYCVGSDGGIASGSTPIQLTADPLQVGMAFSGGIFRQSQVLEGPEGPISGFVTIVVVPEEDEAVSFIPGNQEPSWDDPSSWFGTRLALRYQYVQE